MGLGAGLSAIGGIGSMASMLGGGHNAGAPYLASAGNDYSNMASNANTLSGFGSGAINRLYTPFAGQYAQAQQGLGNYWNNIAQHGLTDAQKNNYLGQFGSFTNPFDQMRSQNALQNSQRGFGGANAAGPNSIAAGANAYANLAQAQNYQGRLSQMGQYANNLIPQAMSNAASAYASPMQMGSQLGMEGLDRGGSMYGSAGSGELNASNMAAQQQAAQNQANAAAWGGLGGLGGLIPGQSGSPASGSSASAQTGSTQDLSGLPYYRNPLLAPSGSSTPNFLAW